MHAKLPILKIRNAAASREQEREVVAEHCHRTEHWVAVLRHLTKMLSHRPRCRHTTAQHRGDTLRVDVAPLLLPKYSTKPMYPCCRSSRFIPRWPRRCRA